MPTHRVFQAPASGPAAVPPSEPVPAPADAEAELVIDLTDEPVIDLTDPNAVLAWKWEASTYTDDGVANDAGDPHDAAWAAYYERVRSADEGDDLDLPDNTNWSKRYLRERGV